MFLLRVVDVERVPLESRGQRVRLRPQLVQGDVWVNALVGGDVLVDLGNGLRVPELVVLLGRVLGGLK